MRQRRFGGSSVRANGRRGERLVFKELAWGGLKAGTMLGEPAPLFPRAEKDAIDRMQNLEDENNRTVIEAAKKSSGTGSAPEAPTAALPVEPSPATASPSVVSVQPTGSGTAPRHSSEIGDHNLTEATTAPTDSGKPVDAIPVAPSSSRSRQRETQLDAHRRAHRRAVGFGRAERWPGSDGSFCPDVKPAVLPQWVPSRSPSTIS